MVRQKLLKSRVGHIVVVVGWGHHGDVDFHAGKYHRCGSRLVVSSSVMLFVVRFATNAKGGRVFGGMPGHARSGDESTSRHKQPELPSIRPVGAADCPKELQRTSIAVMRWRGPTDCQRHHTESEQREADFVTRGEADQCEETVVATGRQMQNLAADDDLTGTFCAIARRNVKELNRATRLVIYMSASIVRFASVSLDLLSGKIGLLGLRAAGHRREVNIRKAIAELLTWMPNVLSKRRRWYHQN